MKNPRWYVLTRAAVFLTGMPIIFYLLLCNALGTHYGEQVDRYDAAAQSISSGWPELRNFNEHSICEAYRYLAAAHEAAEYPPFDACWMIRNWHTDFLEHQSGCK